MAAQLAARLAARSAARDEELAARREAGLAEPHLRPLEDWRAALAARFGAVPHFDPFDGGTRARCLLLLETPGAGADANRFVSRDNATPTARNIARFCAAAGLARHETLIWNAVPWLIHAPGARNRAPRRAEASAGVAELPGLLALLPRLRVAVLAGRVARGAQPLLERERSGLAILTMPHPSPTYVNTAPAIAPGIVATLRRAAEQVRR